MKFDEGRTDFQIAQVVGARAIDQFKVFELRYIRGNNDTESYLAKQSQLDRVKADTYASWGKMRRSLFEIKLLVLKLGSIITDQSLHHWPISLLMIEGNSRCFGDSSSLLRTQFG